MDGNKAIKILMAVACCYTRELHCCDCPLWNKNKEECNAWTNDDVVNAVSILNNKIMDS